MKNVSLLPRIVELEGMIAESRARWLEEGKSKPLTGKMDRFETVRESGLQWTRETAEWSAELEALRAPIVGMCVFEGRVLIATTGGLFQLEGDLLRFVPLKIKAA